MVPTSLILEWKNHPVTLKLYKEINNLREYVIQSLVSGSSLGDNAEQRTAELIGRLRSIELIQNINLKEEEE